MNSESLPRPFLGKILVEAIIVKADAHLREQIRQERLQRGEKIDDEMFNKIIIANAVTEIDEYGRKSNVIKNDVRAPIQKGRIITMAPDAFGQRFVEACGSDVGETPKVGDIIYFIPNDTYRIDPAGRYHLVNDNQVCAIE